jgi:hypothetical protein
MRRRAGLRGGVIVSEARRNMKKEKIGTCTKGSCAPARASLGEFLTGAGGITEDIARARVALAGLSLASM